jgi:hypothetical protein
LAAEALEVQVPTTLAAVVVVEQVVILLRL